METYEQMLEFLSAAISGNREADLSEEKLDRKIAYEKHARKLEKARIALRAEYFGFQDYLKTGKYNTPTIR